MLSRLALADPYLGCKLFQDPVVADPMLHAELQDMQCQMVNWFMTPGPCIDCVYTSFLIAHRRMWLLLQHIFNHTSRRVRV